jgi:hypothetical protein
MTAHCTCGRAWTSLTECHCRTCHRQFSNVTAFDRHQPARGGCPDPATRRGPDGAPALSAVQRADGVVWVKWVSETDRVAMRQRIAASRRGNAGSRQAPRSAEQPPAGMPGRVDQ